MASVGDRIREIREARRMTQDQLAEQSGISKGFLSDVENDKRNVSSDNLLKIANVLGASLDYLLRGTSSEAVGRGPITIPPELAQAAEKLNLSYTGTVELLEAHRSVIARRSNKQAKQFTAEDWENLYRAIQKVFELPMATNLNNHIVVQRLARDLGLRNSAEPVGKILEYCRRRVQRLIEDFDGRNTPAEILPWLAGKLSTCFIEINDDSDLDRVVAEYGKKKEYAFATLAQEFGGCTEGITIRLSRRQLWEPEFVSIIDCRGRRKLRRYHTKWHELVHLLTMTDQTRMEFRRTHEAGEEKSAEEKLVDIIAGELSFFPAFVQPFIHGEITFAKIEQIRTSVCPDASFTSSAINISKMWNSPCIWLEARLQAKKGPASGNPLALRAVKIAENTAAREQGLRMILNFRVPETSIVFRSFYGQTCASEALENLNWWKASSGTCLQNCPIKVEVRSFGDSVQALITPAQLQ